MRTLLFVCVLLSAVSCAKNAETSDSSTDSIDNASSVTDAESSTAISEPATSTEPEGPKPTYGSLSYEPVLFITETLDSSIALLKSHSIAIKYIDAYTDEWDSLKTINFDNSSMTFYRGDGLYYLHTLDIQAAGFPFKNGLTMGMPRGEAISILGIDSTMIQAYGDEGRLMHEWDMNGGSGDTMLYTFIFNKTNFIGLRREYQDMD